MYLHLVKFLTAIWKHKLLRLNVQIFQNKNDDAIE